MIFSKDEQAQIEFYESLSEEQRDLIDRRISELIKELRENGVDEGEIYTLKCTIAKDVIQVARE